MSTETFTEPRTAAEIVLDAHALYRRSQSLPYPQDGAGDLIRAQDDLRRLLEPHTRTGYTPEQAPDTEAIEDAADALTAAVLWHHGAEAEAFVWGDTPISPLIAAADRALRENGPDTWPQDPQRRAEVGWAHGELTRTLDKHARLLNGSMDPFAVRAPEMAHWHDEPDGPLAPALAFVAGEAREDVLRLVKRQAEARRTEDKDGRGEESRTRGEREK
jgi:hypothetical protein